MTTLENLYTSNKKSFIFKVKNYVHSYDVAEEIVQEAFVKALTSFSQYNKKRGSLKGWLTKILFSSLWGHIREAKRRPPIYDIELVLESDLLGYEAEPNLREYLDDIRNPMHKQALLGYFVLGNSYQEVAMVLGQSVDNIRKIVQRFRDGEK